MMCKRLCFHLKNKFELSPQIHFGVSQTQINQSVSRLSLRSFEVKRSLCHHFVSCCPSTCGWIPSRKPPTRVFNWESYWIYQLPKTFFLLSYSHFDFGITQHACIICRKRAFDELSSRTYNLSMKCQKKHLNYGFFSPLFFITKWIFYVSNF